MQTFQCFTKSLNDHASLQRIRDNLQELPKRWLSRAEQPEDYLLGTVTGDSNYHFSFRLEGGGYFQTGVLVASAVTYSSGMPVPLRCRWHRRVGNRPVEIPGVTSNMYQISADDVGTHICVEAEPADADDGLIGRVTGDIGPFELDPATRRNLDNALGVGGSRFIVTQSKAPNDAVTANGRQDIAIYVSNDGLRVVPLQSGAERPGRELAVEYSPEYPKIIIHPLDTTKFQLLVSEAKSYFLVAASRTSRDLIALTIRCFHARKYVSTKAILQQLLPVMPVVPGNAAPASSTSDNRLDDCIILERLAKELNRAMQQKEIAEKVLRNTKHEKEQLQSQLKETIDGFTEVIEGIQDQFGDRGSTSAPATSVERLQEQLHEVNLQNKALQAQIQSERQHTEKLQHSNQAASASSSAAAGEAQRLRETRQLLEARFKEVSSSSTTVQQRDQRDQVHTQELKGLRQDVEMLHNHKEMLRRQLQDSDRERQELQDNFLYVKGQLDKVQMKQAHAAANPAGDGSEIHRHQKTLHVVSEERSRLSARLEGLLREVEKEKAYHEQSLERVMTANARLLEEKDRAAKEVQRLSQLYAESVQQLQGHSRMDSLSHTQSGLFNTDSLSNTRNGSANAAEFARLHTQVAKADEALKKKEQENEALKQRIRKLAVT
mmetsp:Transcript_120904/g.341923  ORF Transcript_120904/g.341923 Transcript_120904/m.341923 type:complete len:662 (-) Transcript_120904:159-2144(-)